VACARWLIAFCVYDLNGFWFYVHGCVGRIIKPREFLAKLIKVFIHFEVFLCVSVFCFMLCVSIFFWSGFGGFVLNEDIFYTRSQWHTFEAPTHIHTHGDTERYGVEECSVKMEWRVLYARVTLTNNVRLDVTQGGWGWELSGCLGWPNIMLASPRSTFCHSRLCYTAYGFSNLMSLCRRKCVRWSVCVCVYNSHGLYVGWSNL